MLRCHELTRSAPKNVVITFALYCSHTIEIVCHILVGGGGVHWPPWVFIIVIIYLSEAVGL